MARPETLYADLEEGRDYPPFDFTVTAADAADYAGTFNASPLQREDGTPVAAAADAAASPQPLPAFLLNRFQAIREHIEFPNGTLLAREVITLHEPAYPGDTLRSVVSVAQKYRKNDKGFVVLNQRITRPADGAHVVDVARTFFWVR